MAKSRSVTEVSIILFYISNKTIYFPMGSKAWQGAN